MAFYTAVRTLVESHVADMAALESENHRLRSLLDATDADVGASLWLEKQIAPVISPRLLTTPVQTPRMPSAQVQTPRTPRIQVASINIPEESQASIISEAKPLTVASCASVPQQGQVSPITETKPLTVLKPPATEHNSMQRSLGRKITVDTSGGDDVTHGDSFDSFHYSALNDSPKHDAARSRTYGSRPNDSPRRVSTAVSTVKTVSLSTFAETLSENSDVVVPPRDTCLRRWYDLVVGVWQCGSWKMAPHDVWLAGMGEGHNDMLLSSLSQRFALEKGFLQRMEGDQCSLTGKREPKKSVFTVSAERKSFSCLDVVLHNAVSHPASWRRIVWIFLSLVLMMYELISVTLIPFGYADTSVAKGLDWVSAIFWSFDICMSLTSGIIIKGKVEMRCVMIAKQYFRTWFCFDLSLAAVQWYLIFASARSVESTGFAFKFVRFLRSLRFGRVFHLLGDELLEKVHQFIDVSSVGEIVRLLIAVFSFVHCSACLWYEVGGANDGWKGSYLKDANDSEAGAKARHYLISLHWALSQLQGNIDIYPCQACLQERLFVVVSSCLSILVLALFVSSITNALVAARLDRTRRQAERRAIHHFFENNSIKPALRARARYFLKCRGQQERIRSDREEENRTLQLFPSQLRMHLISETRGEHLIWHPGFAYLQQLHVHLFIRVCSEALTAATSEPGQELFRVGEMSKQVYIISNGEFLLNTRSEVLDNLLVWFDDMRQMSQISSLIHEANDEEAPQTTGKTVDRFAKGDRICEAALWLAWRHGADLTSVDFGQLYTVGSAELMGILREYPVPYGVFASYAPRLVSVAKSMRTAGVTEALTLELLSFQSMFQVERNGVRKSVAGTVSSTFDVETSSTASKLLGKPRKSMTLRQVIRATIFQGSM